MSHTIGDPCEVTFIRPYYGAAQGSPMRWRCYEGSHHGEVEPASDPGFPRHRRLFWRSGVITT